MNIIRVLVFTILFDCIETRREGVKDFTSYLLIWFLYEFGKFFRDLRCSSDEVNITASFRQVSIESIIINEYN